MQRRVMLSLAATGLALLSSQPGAAQVRASEAALVQQTVDGTKISIEYSRPGARGRKLFGGVVHWGERWTPGANWATTLEADHDIRLAGQEIPKGKYSLWLVTREHAEWSLFVQPDARVYHTQRPDTTKALTRIAVKPDSAPHLERLTFSFPTVTPDGAVLQFHWGTTRFQLPIRVQPSRPVVLDAATAQKYVGIYALQSQRLGTARMEVFTEGTRLRGRLVPNVFPYDPVFDLIPSSKDRFNPLFYREGQPFDLEDFAVVFLNVGERAGAVEWRGINEEAISRGTRLPQ
jgi:hypothetical protein